MGWRAPFYRRTRKNVKTIFVKVLLSAAEAERTEREKEMTKYESRMMNSFRSATAGLGSAMRRRIAFEMAHASCSRWPRIADNANKRQSITQSSARALEVDRLLLKMPVRLGSMANQSPKSQTSGGTSRPAVAGPTRSGQRVPPIRTTKMLHFFPSTNAAASRSSAA